MYRQLHALIRQAAPDAKETVKYGIPTFVLEGRNLVHLSAYASHVGLYGGGAMKLTGPLAKFQTGKGTLRFEPGQKLPLVAITRLIRQRVAETLAHVAKPKAKKPKKRR